MKQDLFQFLPSEITFNILSRLHVRAIATSKCVCKPWLDLLETNDFVNSHLSKSVPALAVLMAEEEEEERNSVCCKLYEFEDEDEADDVRRYIPLTKFDFLLLDRANIVGAADGILVLRENSLPYFHMYICNPITREYVELCFNIEETIVSTYPEMKYGFGASKITGQHKVIQILQPKPKSKSDKWDVSVYTLETGLWRRFEATFELELKHRGMYGAFVNGNLHWLSKTMIACFDLETDCFSMFSPPPLEETAYNPSICVFKDYLCVCAFMQSEDYDGRVIEIWLMKEYGVEKSWTKEYVNDIRPSLALDLFDPFYPIKAFKNGDILISGGDLVSSRDFTPALFDPYRYAAPALFHFSNKTQIPRMFRPSRGRYLYSRLFAPSFLSLKRNLGMENVISF